MNKLNHIVCKIVTLLFFCVYSYLSAQISNSFDDSLWYIRDNWYGQVHDFTINGEKQLQSIGNTNGISRIYTNSIFQESQEWQFWLRLNFAPSAANRMKIYLSLDDTTINKANGYFIEIGDDGSMDAIKLYKLISGKATILAEGINGAVAKDPTQVRIKITRSPLHEWTLYTDYNGNKDFGEEFYVLDASVPIKSNTIFGIECNYTSTRRDKFLLDDILIDKYTPVESPPKIKSILSDSNLVIIGFDKAIDSITANDPENYAFTGGLNQPWKAVLIQDSLVYLSVVKNILPGTYEVLCKKITDRKGNSAFNVKGTWIHTINQKLKVNDLLITEMMIDPTPTAGLPEYEYIEIYNNSNKTIDLAPLKINFDKNEYTIDTISLLLNAGEYIILCEASANIVLKKFGKTFVMKRMPTLRNTDGTLRLLDRSNVIYSVSYTDDWYGDSKKNDGGWSLEMINPENVCDDGKNWSASVDIKGGSPGVKNSLYDLNYKIALIIDSFVVSEDNRSIELFLNKKINTPTIENALISPSINITALFYSDSMNKIKAVLSSALNKGILYTLEFKLKDCIGRPMNTTAISFAKSEIIEKNDLILNEILFNPVSGAFDYIEIYNRSDKALNIEKLRISNEINQRSVVLNRSRILLPGTFWVITSDISSIRQNYLKVDTSKIIVNSLPSLPDDKGNVSIWSIEQQLIDSFNYSEEYHYKLINNKEGVALERMNTERFSSNNNWHSAASVENYGTPTRKNSVTGSRDPIEISSFKLTNKTFSPDADGNEDELRIEYQMATSGFQAQVTIFDDQGRRIKRLYNNVLLSREGIITWDGKNEDGVIGLNGIYLITIGAIHLDGTVVNKRFSTVLYR